MVCRLGWKESTSGLLLLPRGQLANLSTATSWSPAPIAQRISVAWGESETMRWRGLSSARRWPSLSGIVSGKLAPDVAGGLELWPPPQAVATRRRSSAGPASEKIFRFTVYLLDAILLVWSLAAGRPAIRAGHKETPARVSAGVSFIRRTDAGVRALPRGSSQRHPSVAGGP